MPTVDSKVSLSKKAYRRIKDLIISVNLSPGKQIDEFALAKELGIGRIPIREAILQLDGEGLLESLPGRGHCVKAIDLNDIKALFEALLISERAVVVQYVVTHPLPSHNPVNLYFSHDLLSKSKFISLGGNDAFYI